MPKPKALLVLLASRLSGSFLSGVGSFCPTLLCAHRSRSLTRLDVHGWISSSAIRNDGCWQSAPCSLWSGFPTDMMQLVCSLMLLALLCAMFVVALLWIRGPSSHTSELSKKCSLPARILLTVRAACLVCHTVFNSRTQSLAHMGESRHVHVGLLCVKTQLSFQSCLKSSIAKIVSLSVRRNGRAIHFL